MSVYTVSPEGTIQFPILGELKVAGMSRSELSGFIKGELMGRDLVKDPTVTVEFVNTGINVLGEVNSPGRIEVNREPPYHPRRAGNRRRHDHTRTEGKRHGDT